MRIFDIVKLGGTFLVLSLMACGKSTSSNEEANSSGAQSASSAESLNQATGTLIDDFSDKTVAAPDGWGTWEVYSDLDSGGKSRLFDMDGNDLTQASDLSGLFTDSSVHFTTKMTDYAPLYRVWRYAKVGLSLKLEKDLFESNKDCFEIDARFSERDTVLITAQMPIEYDGNVSDPQYDEFNSPSINIEGIGQRHLYKLCLTMFGVPPVLETPSWDAKKTYRLNILHRLFTYTTEEKFGDPEDAEIEIFSIRWLEEKAE